MKDGKLKLNITPRTGYLVLLAMAWSLEIIVFYSRVVLTKLFLGSTAVGYAVVITFVVLAIVVAIPYFLQRLRLRDFIFVLAAAAFYIITMTGTSSVLLSYYLGQQAVTTLLACLPMFLVGICIEQEDVPLLHATSIASIIAFTLYMLLFGNAKGDFAEESMSVAYALLMHVCTVCFFAVREHKPLDIVLAIYGIILLLFLGTRGPVVLSLSFLVVSIICFSGRSNLSKAISLLALVALITVILVYFDEIIDYLSETADSLHMSTRIFDSIRESEFAYSSGRDNIQSELMTYIWEKPITGYGLAYDRVLVGHYAHNMIVEFWVSYGLFLGTAMILWIIVQTITAIVRYRKSKMLIVVLLMLFTGGFGKLMLSGSYLTEHVFFLFLGVLAGQGRHIGTQAPQTTLPETAVQSVHAD